jgi:hypothetical protein
MAREPSKILTKSEVKDMEREKEIQLLEKEIGKLQKKLDKLIAKRKPE